MYFGGFYFSGFYISLGEDIVENKINKNNCIY